MRVCCTGKRKAKKFRKIKLGTLLVLIGTLVLLIWADGYVRSIIRGYPMSVATGVVQNLMDSAMEQVLSNEEMPDMSGIDKVVYTDDKTVKSIETDTRSLNIVKTAFVSRVKNVFNSFGNYINIKVPIGTLMGYEYTLGRGPDISFRLQFSTTVTTSLESSFEEAGINNTQHTIYMNVSCNLFLLIPWGSETTTVKTNYILAQTIIAGEVPEAFTNVYDGTGDIADDLFNYGAEID